MEANDKPFLPALALFVWALIAIATSAAVWNAHSGGFLSAVAAVNLIINGWCIYKQAKKLSDN